MCMCWYLVEIFYTWGLLDVGVLVFSRDFYTWGLLDVYVLVFSRDFLYMGVIGCVCVGI